MADKHTPGPWRAEGLAIFGADDECLAHVVDDLDPDGDGLAKYDAILIAEAPDMLEALRLAAIELRGFKQVFGDWDASDQARLDVVEAVLAKFPT